MTKITIEQPKEVNCTFSDLSRGEFFRDAKRDDGKFFIKCEQIIEYGTRDEEHRWNCVCVDSTGTLGWHASFDLDDPVIPVSEVIIKV